MVAQFSDSVVFKFDDDDEYFDADDRESPEPSFVFKFEYQTREILKQIEKVDEIGPCVAFQAQNNSTSCFIEESQNGSAHNSSCDSIETVEVNEEKNAHVHVEEGDQGFGDGAFQVEEVEKRVVIEQDSVLDEEKEAQVINEVKFGSVVNEEMSHLDVECDSTGGETMVTASHEDDELVSSSEFDSDSICSNQEDDDDDGELGALEDIGLFKPDGFDEQDNDIMEQLRELEELCGTDDQKSKRFKPQGDKKRYQMKMELKKVRDATGLPTIHEESEFMDMDDLKPLNIVNNIYHTEDALYKSYRTRMGKLDILNNKKLGAIGDLQFKHSLKLFSSYKSFLSNLRLCRPEVDCDPMIKLIREVNSELEVVYVGQLCLSWEFLQCQYEKAFESAPNRVHSYNEVTEELQQFRVLLQRFVEDEQFQGPRVENYVKSRYAMHKLLQVPEIREDRWDEGKEGNETAADIVETLGESRRTLWQFIRADKNANITTACRKRSLPSGLDPKLFVQVQADLREKERMLKELKRSQNRIIKRLIQKHEEEGEDDEDSTDHDHLNFFSQVDIMIRLVSRVLNMSTITQDQLGWCQRKLSKINFVRRKIHVDPSFLFPC